MHISMTLPTMASGMDRGITNEWCARIDEGPFRSLAIGERIAFDNLEMHTTLAYAAARTERVRIAPTLVILPMHPVALHPDLSRPKVLEDVGEATRCPCAGIDMGAIRRRRRGAARAAQQPSW